MIKVDSKGNITLPLHMVPSRGYMLRVPKFSKQFFFIKVDYNFVHHDLQLIFNH